MINMKAVRDLEGIWLCTVTKWSAAQADRYHGLIIEEID